MDKFACYLRNRIGARSLDSYLSMARRIQRDLNIHLADMSLDESVIELLLLRLKKLGHPTKSLSNFRSVLRAYARIDVSEPPATILKAQDHAAPTCHEKPSDLAGMPVSELLSSYAAILTELKDRAIIRTGNSPVGDYGEHLFQQAFRWKLEPNNSSGFDARCSTGLRYQIKARRLSHPSASRQLSALRRLDERNFDFLAAVIFRPDFTVLKAVLVPYDVAQARASYVAHTNSWRIMLDDKLCSTTGVQDVTVPISKIAEVL